MVERWTRERRLEHTRALLLDAAEEVFAEKGFTAATLDDIAHTAGYTKGAIYKHFAAKEDLFLAVSDRYWRRYFDNFAEVLSAATELGARELDDIAQRWRQLSNDRGAEHAALGHEFTLYLLRNPDARERVATKRSEVVEALGKFIVEGIDDAVAAVDKVRSLSRGAVRRRFEARFSIERAARDYVRVYQSLRADPIVLPFRERRSGVDRAAGRSLMRAPTRRALSFPAAALDPETISP